MPQQLPIADFFDAAQAYVSPEGTAVFTTSFHIIKESSSFVRLPLERPLGGGKRGKSGGGSDGFQARPLPSAPSTAVPSTVPQQHTIGARETPDEC